MSEFIFLIWQILLWVLSYLVALVVNYNIDILNYWHPKYTKYTNQRGKKRLFDAGLGEKKITFPKNDNPTTFKQILEKQFEGLQTCGGYELMHREQSVFIETEDTKYRFYNKLSFYRQQFRPSLLLYAANPEGYWWEKNWRQGRINQF